MSILRKPRTGLVISNSTEAGELVDEYRVAYAEAQATLAQGVWEMMRKGGRLHALDMFGPRSDIWVYFAEESKK